MHEHSINIKLSSVTHGSSSHLASPSDYLDCLHFPLGRVGLGPMDNGLGQEMLTHVHLCADRTVLLLLLYTDNQSYMYGGDVIVTS